ncbi:MAG: hypothetical protein JSS09_06225 [Verrucomicrobia bacterium]|nr:hypothetical protein [Verrucomicrobiota bacterium]
MNNTQWIVCKAFIDKKAKETKETLLSFLSPKQKKELLTSPSPASDLTLGFDQIKYLLEWSHYSWFAPFLRTLSENEISFFLSVLPEKTAQHLREYLLFSFPLPSLSLTIKSFIQRKLAEVLLIENPNLVPIEILPTSPLHCLLTLTSSEISWLVDFLGLHDLAIEMRLIIDTVKIKKIHSVLSKEKIFFLSLLTNRQEPQLFKPMNLNAWNGNPEDLPGLLHKRGMNRLINALSLEDPNFVDYIKLRMSNDHASFFSLLHKNQENTKAYKIIVGQIMDILAFFKKNNIKDSS